MFFGLCGLPKENPCTHPNSTQKWLDCESTSFLDPPLFSCVAHNNNTSSILECATTKCRKHAFFTCHSPLLCPVLWLVVCKLIANHSLRTPLTYLLILPTSRGQQRLELLLVSHACIVLVKHITFWDFAMSRQKCKCQNAMSLSKFDCIWWKTSFFLHLYNPKF